VTFANVTNSYLQPYSLQWNRVLGTDKQKNIQLFIVGWASYPPSPEGGRDAHPTRLNNLFVGNLLFTLLQQEITKPT
jgi:hypothetical protein